MKGFVFIVGSEQLKCLNSLWNNILIFTLKQIANVVNTSDKMSGYICWNTNHIMALKTLFLNDD